jgi:hypothetical protein
MKCNEKGMKMCRGPSLNAHHGLLKAVTLRTKGEIKGTVQVASKQHFGPKKKINCCNNLIKLVP